METNSSIRPKNSTGKALFAVFIDSTFFANKTLEFNTPTTISEVAKKMTLDFFLDSSERVAALAQKYDQQFDAFSLADLHTNIEDGAKYEIRYRTCSSVEDSTWEQIMQQGDHCTQQNNTRNEASGLTATEQFMLQAIAAFNSTLARLWLFNSTFVLFVVIFDSRK
uniref:PsbP domain-containing protein n=1 Tax=Steinernema glaseri TaxID=37863 RepID=A0A1I7ZSB8_9BILA